MNKAFNVHYDARGDFWMADGSVICKASGSIFPVGNGDAAGSSFAGQSALNYSETAPVPEVNSLIFLGGSGGNLIVTGHAEFEGIWRREFANSWTFRGYHLTVNGTDAVISDDSDVIATGSGSGVPAVVFTATTYGSDHYNSGTAFTLNVATETGWPGGLLDLDINISGGTAVGGLFTTEDGIHFTCSTDANWKVNLNSDGTADFLYGSEVIASRGVGPKDDPCGYFVATEAGERLNPEPGDPVTDVRGETNPFGTLTLSFGWAGTPDLDIGVSFAGETVGYGYASTGQYLSWSGDNTTTGGPETVVVDLAQAWEDGVIDAVADVVCLADWYPPANGSGPATLTVTYDPPGSTGSPETITLHPGLATPASTEALALRITASGSVTPTGSPWTATVRAVRRAPVEGICYIQINELAGAVQSVCGPYFSASIPASTETAKHFPIATSNGTGKLKQLQTGPLVWIVGGSGTANLATSFEIDGNGDLIMSYSGDAPDLTIDGSGDLILTY